MNVAVAEVVCVYDIDRIRLFLWSLYENWF
jgi:hypothetical protein